MSWRPTARVPTSTTASANGEVKDEEDLDVEFDLPDEFVCEDDGDADGDREVLEQQVLPPGNSTSSDACKITQPSLGRGGEAVNHDNEWQSLLLSKPLLKALADLHYEAPTPIQATIIPLALQGRDILATAQTGSGKTAAFLLPTIERLCQSWMVRQRTSHRHSRRSANSGATATKALILLPTRELALQCYEMLNTLAKFTAVTRVLVTGGMAVRAQEAATRHQPDILVATPGRVLDFLLNSPGVHLELLEIFILDEADRLLELGFRDAILSIAQQLAKGRQTMLFSATLSGDLSDLANLSLQRPLRIDASVMVRKCGAAGSPAPGADTAGSRTAGRGSTRQRAAVQGVLPRGLEHLLVLLPSSAIDPHPGPEAPELSRRKQKVDKSVEDPHKLLREAAVLDLFTEGPCREARRAIVFFRTKAAARRASLLLSALSIKGLSHAELHGNLPQDQRLRELTKFRNGEVRVLVCSELAARGLDIHDVDVVINTAVPPEVSRYIHQAGRTARIGQKGLVITLVTWAEKLQAKRILRGAGVSAAPKIVPDRTSLRRWQKKVRALEPEIARALQRDRVDSDLRTAHAEATRALNCARFASEIKQRPRRRWLTGERHRRVG